jgi:DNA ligase (NAD+)
MQGDYLVCSNTIGCKAQISGAIKTWISALNILEWGETLIDRLVETGKVNTIPDLYKLSIEDLMSIERMGARSAEKCFNLLWAQPAVPLEILLGALSIPLVAVSTIEFVIAAGYDTLDKILALSEEQLIGIKGIGPAKAASMYKGLKRNRKLIFELLEQGIAIKENEVMSKENNGGKLSGMKICFTG